VDNGDRMKMKQENMDLLSQTRYFTDPEEGKQWLLGKLNK